MRPALLDKNMIRFPKWKIDMQHRHEVLESCCAGGHFGQVGSLLTLDFAFAILLAELSQLISHGAVRVYAYP